jgi:hypothetical protein
MSVQSVAPDPGTSRFLAGAQFADAFRLTVANGALDSRHAAERMMGRSPRWVSALLAVRDAIVKPLGLTTSKSARRTPVDRVGMFPVISQTPERLVAGFDDSHLDFRVVVDVAPASGGQNVTATTLVLTHNRLGRIYLAVITPFHRLIVRAMLRQVAD